MKVQEQGQVRSMGTLLDAIPEAEACRIYDLADRAVEFWQEVAKMVQLCHDAGLGSWRELRAMKPKKLERLADQAAMMLARKERERAKAAAAALVPHLDDIVKAERQRRAEAWDKLRGWTGQKQQQGQQHGQRQAQVSA